LQTEVSAAEALLPAEAEVQNQPLDVHAEARVLPAEVHQVRDDRYRHSILTDSYRLASGAFVPNVKTGHRQQSGGGRFVSAIRWARRKVLRNAAARRIRQTGLLLAP
jgi:hypothetical protein